MVGGIAARQTGGKGSVYRAALGLTLGVACAWLLAAGCGDAEGADELKGPGGTTSLGGASSSGGAGGLGGTGGVVVGGASTGGFAPVSDPYVPPTTNIETWTGTLPPGGLLDPEVLVYYPAEPAAGETFPLMVFAHEEGLGEDDYAGTLSHIARFGYVVASVEYLWNPLDEDHHAPNDWMRTAIELLTTDPPEAIGDIVDGERIAVSGHGIGGKAAIWMVLEEADVQALVAFDPIDDQRGLIHAPKRPSLTPELMGWMAVPSLYLATEYGPEGIANCVPHESNACRFFEETPDGVPAWLAVLEGFGHLQMVDGFNCVACFTCNRGEQQDHVPTQVVARGLTVAFLEYTLRGKLGYLPYLEGAELEALRAEHRVLDDQEQFGFCAEQ